MHAAALRFWTKVQIGPIDECWPFVGARDPHGYGCFAIGKSRKFAHRFAWEFVSGKAPNGVLCHRCDNPSCVNPMHLFEGTQSDNIRDASNKGRMAGQGLTHCKSGHEFTPENTYIRANGLNARQCRKCNAEAARRYAKRKTA